jgi:nucleoid-associated protein YgaU
LPSGDEPPVVSVEGAGLPDPGPDKWVITGIDWPNASVIQDFNSGGVMVRMRQDAVVHLLEHVDEDRAAFARLAPAAGSWPKHYTVKHGDTIQKISAKFYKTPKKWKLIARANNLRDPRHLHVGKTLIIPKP